MRAESENSHLGRAAPASDAQVERPLPLRTVTASRRKIFLARFVFVLVDFAAGVSLA